MISRRDFARALAVLPLGAALPFVKVFAPWSPDGPGWISAEQPGAHQIIVLLAGYPIMNCTAVHPASGRAILYECVPDEHFTPVLAPGADAFTSCALDAGDLMRVYYDGRSYNNSQRLYWTVDGWRLPYGRRLCRDFAAALPTPRRL